MEVNKDELLSPDDILSAALSEAGLDEFFVPPSTSDDVATTASSDDVATTTSESPSTSTVVVVAADSSNVASTSTTSQPSELASPSTASTGSSPDLPVDGTSPASTPSTSSAVNNSKLISGIITSSPGITARPTSTINKNNTNIVVKPANQFLKTAMTTTPSPLSTSTLPGMAKFIKYINPDGKMYIVPMSSSSNQKQIHSPNIRLIVARKQPLTQQILAAKGIQQNGVVRHLIAPDMIPPTLDPILPIQKRPGMVGNSGGGVLRMSSDYGVNAMRQQIPINRLMRPPPQPNMMQTTFRHNNYARQRLMHPPQAAAAKRSVRFNPNVDVRDHLQSESPPERSINTPPPARRISTGNRTAARPRLGPPQPFGLSVSNEVEIVATQNKPQNLYLPSISGTQLAPLTTSNSDDLSKTTNGRQTQQSSSRTAPTSAQKSDSREPVSKGDPVQSESAGNQADDDDEEDWGHAETYSEYMPSKLRSGLPHPDPVVETASLSSVMPPDVTYHFSIPEQIIDTGKLSALQLEAIIYACQQHEQFNPNGERVGYLIGDGAGVGKGRTVAGLIYENYLLGRKRALWFSVSSDLKYDAERDLSDIGAERIKVHALNKFKYSKISGKENGGVKKGVIFATYSSLIGESNNAKSKYRTRLKQVIHWCGGKDYDGVIVFDECHRAKNLVPTGSSKPTKTGLTVLDLQKELPKARVIYASATGATETRNMAYMTRLGLWGPGKPFKDFNDFIMAVEKRGVGAMEIVAMDMKQRGLYLARQLSFSGTSFRIEEVPLSKEFIHIYDESVKLWLEAKKQFQIASKLIDVERTDRKSMWGQFWAAHQRFFKYLCIAAKVNACVRMAREAVKNGKCVVVGLQSTGEARTLEQLDECGGELNDFVSTAKSVFMSLVEKHFPMSDGKGDSNRRNYSLKDAKSSLFTDTADLFGDEKRRTSNKRKASDRQVATKRKKLEQDNTTKLSSDEETEDNSKDDDRSSKDDDERSSGATSDDDDQSTGSESKSNDSSSSTDSDDDDDEETEEHFNPFADEEEEQDPWEIKLKQTQRKKYKKRRKQEKKDLEEVDELGKQLEEAMEEQEEDEILVQKEVRQSQVSEVSVDVEEFLGSSSSFFESGFERQDRFGDNFGLSQANMMKAELMAAIERLGDLLPANTLDQLIDELGGSEYVAEMTGRKGRVVSREDGEIQYELRNEGDVPLELLNLAEKERFMNGQKHIAIISEAASSGISLQSDRRAKNQRRRVHITLELPWSADKAIQQFGRTHRSNQVNAPEYVFLISELAGEYRFASVVAKRLESLGALTHGDRRATESRDLSQFNLDTKYGRAALELTLKSILGYAAPVIKPPVGYKGEFDKDMRQYLEGVGLAFRESEASPYCLEKDVNISKFLNRILGLPVYAQNTLFQYFADTLKAVVDEAKRDGRYDQGIMDLGSGREQVKKVETRVFIGKFDAGGYRTELHLVSVERGLSWEEVSDIYSQHTKPDDGFYISLNPNIKTTAVLICAVGRRRLETNERLYNVFRPNTGLNPNMETLVELKQRYKKVLPDIAQPIWQEQYDISLNRCQHTFWYGKCRNELAGLTCEIGKRKRSYYILSGSVLSVWNTVESVLSGYATGRRQARMQVVRVRTEHQKIVGILIPNTFVRSVVERLTEESSRTYLELFNF